MIPPPPVTIDDVDAKLDRVLAALAMLTDQMLEAKQERVSIAGKLADLEADVAVLKRRAQVHITRRI